MSKRRVDERGREQVPAWYGIAITTNKEKVVRNRINTLAQSEQWKDEIFECILPSYMDLNAKGKEVEKLHITQVGYVHMILNTETWNALEMLRGVGFRAILPAGNAQPIPEDDMRGVFNLIGRDFEKELIDFNNDFEIGEKVKIVDDKQEALYGQEGEILEINEEANEVQITIDMLGKPTKIKLKFNQVERLN